MSIIVTEAPKGSSVLDWCRTWLATNRGVPVATITGETTVTPSEVYAGANAFIFSGLCQSGRVGISNVDAIKNVKALAATIDDKKA